MGVQVFVGVEVLVDVAVTVAVAVAVFVAVEVAVLVGVEVAVAVGVAHLVLDDFAVTELPFNVHLTVFDPEKRTCTWSATDDAEKLVPWPQSMPPETAVQPIGVPEKVFFVPIAR